MQRFLSKLGKQKRAGEKGFTLIELLIVVAIIGILAAVIIPNVTTFMNTGRLNAARTEAENVKTAALAYFADHNTEPSLVGLPIRPMLVTGQYVTGALKGAYTFDTTSGNITKRHLISRDGTLFHWDGTDADLDQETVATG